MSLYCIGFVALKVLCVAFVALLIVRIATGLHKPARDGAMAALERRFVSGDIAEEDFRRMRDILRS